MKKNLITSFILFIFLIICSLTIYLINNITFTKVWIPLVIGFSIFIISVILCITSNHCFILNYLSMFLSSISLGFMIDSFVIYKKIELNIYLLLLISFISSIYILLFYLYSLNPFFDKHPNIWSSIFFLISIMIIIMFILWDKLIDWSFIGFYLVISISYILVLCFDIKDFEELLHSLCIASLSILIVGIIIGIILLDGDLDFDLGLGGNIEFKNYKNKINK